MVVSMRSISFRVDVLRGGVRFDQLLYTQAPTIYTDATANIKMTFKGTFLHNEKVNYISDELRPIMIVNGVDYPLGVYKIVTKREQYSAANQAYDEIEAYDRGIALTWSKIEQREFWPAGTPYDNIISSYLTRAGIKHVAYTSSKFTLQSDREDWDIGAEFLTIVNTLLSEMNYQSLWFDVAGIAQVKPYTKPSANIIDHSYGTHDIIKMLGADCSSEIDLYAQPNVFIAILENPEYDKPLIKTAINDTPASKLSTISRGIRIPAVYKVQNIASESALQEYINKVRDESMQMSEDVSIQTIIAPNHNVGDVIALTHPKIRGIFRETGWSITLDAGQYMPHKLQRVVII